MSKLSRAAGILAVLALVSGQMAVAQQPSGGHHHGDESMDQMMGDTKGARHLTLTPRWQEQPEDRARADSVVAAARAALSKYGDVALAERDGYRMFAAKVKQQRVYHYSNRSNALKARSSFDATEPSALLYRPEAGGKLRLIGAMYTAPADISLEDLNQRIPLSVAQWHQHTSLCLPPGSNPRDKGGDMGLMTRDPRFGPRGSITTEADCTVAGGQFKKRMFAWMVHVNMFESADRVWGH